MSSANFNTGEYKDSTWTLKKSGNGYTMQDANGKYVNISGQNVELTDTPQCLQLETANMVDLQCQMVLTI